MPIFKGKGDKADPNNYRPISLTPIISKIFEKCVLVAIADDIDRLLLSNQHGFRKNRSTISNLLDSFEEIYEHLDKKIPVDVIYLDLSRAFDKVPHSILIDKLYATGLDNKVIRIIYKFLTNRTYSVRVGDSS